MTIPPAQQCTLPSCEEEAVDPTNPGALCQNHLGGLESEEPVTKPDESDGSDPLCDTSPVVDTSHVQRIETIPSPLDELGEAFIPFDPGEKGARRSRTSEHLLAPDDPVLEAYLEAGHNYGVVTRGDLAVVDADEPERLRGLLDALPATAWQVSGSRTSEHYFLRVPGLDADLPLVDPDSGAELGHIKGAEQSYVVGPGSRHPSGNRYGPLEGDAIATVDEDELRELIDPFRPGDVDRDRVPTDLERARNANAGDSTGLSVHDVLSRRRYPESERRDHPFHGSDTGANFMVDDGGDTWRCWRHGCTGNALHLVGIEQGVISCGDWKHTGLNTDTWRDVFTAARDAGYDLPEHEGAGDDGVEQVAALPDTELLKGAASGWDWRHAGAREATEEDLLEQARGRTTEKIAGAIGSGDRVLVEALPTLGKSYGAVKAAAETGNPVTILTTRGNKEQYGQIEEWCEKFGLTHKRLPAFTRHCETARGDHGEDWKQTVLDWYNRGATPKQIHALAEQAHGSELPCQHDGQCELASAWDFDPDEHPDTVGDDVESRPWDVLIGHYTHAYKSKVVHGRTVLFDEFAEEAFEQRLDHGIEGAVSYFLQQHEPLPFDDYADLLEGRHDDQRRADALAFLDEYGIDSDPTAVLGDQAGHAGAPAAVFTILVSAKENLGNGWERAELPDDRVGLFDRETGAVSILSPPELTYTSAVVGLDGTPTRELWELVLGERLNHTQVLTDAERREYLADGLNLNLVRTTEAIKPYNNPDHVAVDRDLALLDAIAEQHDTKPGVITSRRALDVYSDAGAIEYDPESGDVDDGPADRVAWFGNVIGSNRFKETRVGAVIGSNHYGDRYIQKWGAYAGEAVERGDGRGADLSYGRLGDKVLAHMREHDTLQAAMRFGRDGNGAVVYVHTDTLPEWVPIAGEGRVLSTWSDGMRQVIDVANELGEWTTAEIATHPDVEIGERQVRDHLTTLAEKHGVLERRTEGCGFVWRDSGLHRIGEHGDVELEPVELETLTGEESAELARSSIYTWEFRTSRPSRSVTARATGTAVDRSAKASTNGGDPPPDDGE
ncbi:bifunctional DNA primase/polymerase [Natrinema halophilum]|uniref:Bifunctional DNA primase/polymerase n=1 Tax=Natrinema halophilum TaxID=1699371 RepID=A0A7D5GKC1_9EURY|nr:bifunctional DNA primase/polymerase [Natrinema halophilum]QLG49090.1 bifunctional DNA primase/polymerase [Natrinema halophilum]